jgi:hypothetical protein
MSDAVESFLNQWKPILTLVDEVLGEWNGEGCYQVPGLVKLLSVRLNWDSETARQSDPVIRAFLRNHPVWYITRGAHGGIMLRAEHQRKEAIKVARDKAKEELKAAVKLRLESQSATSASVITGQDNTNTVSE